MFARYKIYKQLIYIILKELLQAGRWWLMLVILATQEAEIRGIVIRSQPGEIVRETLS
jgi:hypothetical protein